ncbi:MAG: alpha/beta fold hydrolase, partial [Myxococcota bacterium]
LGTAKRLRRVTCPVKLVWGSEDRLMPPSYAKRFAKALGSKAEIVEIRGAGHALDFDAPGAAAKI